MRTIAGEHYIARSRCINHFYHQIADVIAAVGREQQMIMNTQTKLIHKSPVCTNLPLMCVYLRCVSISTAQRFPLESS